MCLSPVMIPNPYKGANLSAKVRKLKDCTSAYIPVPCGVCSECIHTAQMAIMQRVLLESKVNHVFMIMLSYNDESLPVYIAPDGKKFKYANWKHIQDMFKRIRKDEVFGSRSPRYLCCSEFGGERHRPHFHLLLFLKKFDSDDRNDILNLTQLVWNTFFRYWAVNIGSKRNPKYKPLFTYYERLTRKGWKRNFDVQFVESEKSAAAYCTKYLLKDSDYVRRLRSAVYLNYDNASEIWSILRPRTSRSLGFGLNATLGDNHKVIPDSSLIKKLKSDVALSIRSADFPIFYSDSASFPLARYYKKRGDVMSVDDALAFHDKQFDKDSDSFIVHDVEHISTIKGKVRKGNRISSFVKSRDDVLDDF